MIDKRPSWKDILWTPIYDFIDERWGINGLRLFAISIALFPALVLFWGWIKHRAQMPRDAGESVLVVDLSDAVRTDVVERTDLVGLIEPAEGFPVWRSELDVQLRRFDTQFRRYVKELRENVRSVGAVWSGGITAMAVFLSDFLEKCFSVMVEAMGDGP